MLFSLLFLVFFPSLARAVRRPPPERGALQRDAAVDAEVRLPRPLAAEIEAPSDLLRPPSDGVVAPEAGPEAPLIGLAGDDFQRTIQDSRAEPGRVSAALGRVFDGLFQSWQDKDEPFIHEPPQDLVRLAAPWRVETQLKRVAELKLDPEKPVFVAVFGDAEPGRFLWSRVLFSRRLLSNPRIFLDTVLKRRWVLKRIVAEIEKSPAVLAIGLGDFISSGTWRNWRSFFKEWNGWSPKKIYVLLKGNHENRAPHNKRGDPRYHKLLGSPKNHFDAGPVRFILPDTSGAGLGRRQIHWMRGAMKADRPKVILTHKPPAYLGDWTDYGPFKGSGGFKNGIGAFDELSSRADVLSTYYGHIHASDELLRNGARHRLTGGGGSLHYPSKVKEKHYEWLLLKLMPGGFEETVYRWVWDAGGGRFVDMGTSFIAARKTFATAGARPDATAGSDGRP